MQYNLWFQCNHSSFMFSTASFQFHNHAKSKSTCQTCILLFQITQRSSVKISSMCWKLDFVSETSFLMTWLSYSEIIWKLCECCFRYRKTFLWKNCMQTLSNNYNIFMHFLFWYECFQKQSHIFWIKIKSFFTFCRVQYFCQYWSWREDVLNSRNE